MIDVAGGLRFSSEVPLTAEGISEFAFRFRTPVRVPQTVTLEWLVVRTDDVPRLGGQVVELRGRLLTETGRTAVGAKGKALVAEHS